MHKWIGWRNQKWRTPPDMEKRKGPPRTDKMIRAKNGSTDTQNQQN
jgi:hypothetical protein